MHRPRRIQLLAAGAALVVAALAAGPASAAQPAMFSWSNHRDGPVLDCPTFTAHGEWDISHTLTLYLDANGVATGDLERVAFTGRFYNPDTQVSVPDSGTKRFLDTLAPDGSYLSTVMTYQRTDAFVHESGRLVLGAADANGDQPELRSVGHDGFTDANVDALCRALGA